jgi:hypothetical protein
MTGSMVDAIDAGEFKDPVWVSMLLGRFAEYYFEGLDRCECCADDRPMVWDFTHRASKNCDLHVMQHLLLGINAHINYDLVLTLREILADEWPNANDELRSLRLQDHHTVNDIIARTIDTVQDNIIEVASPIMDILDKIMGRVDEYLLSRLIKSWRTDVWNEAMQMLNAQDPAHEVLLRSRLEQKVILRAHHILLK